MSHFCQSLYSKIDKRMENPYLLGVGMALNLSFTYLAYPFAVWRLGLVRGGMVMTALSVALHYLAISLYARSGKDWFGLEALKNRIGMMEGGGKAGRFMAWALKKSGPLALIVLSVKFDPFITTVCLRREGFHGLDLRDRLIFLTSAAIGNGYCIFLTFGGGRLIKHLQRFI